MWTKLGIAFYLVKKTNRFLLPAASSLCAPSGLDT
jgi:hypothetical protein